MQKSPLFGLTLYQLTDLVLAEGLPKFAAKQLADWLYKKDIESIDEMTNLSLDARKKLSEKYRIGLVKPSKVAESTDGTKKYLFATESLKFVEAAYIPDNDRATLCVSSQVGCKMGCLFCMTGKQGFQGNLSAGEIVNQLRSIPEWHKVTNIVYMGMGEPLDNLDNVLSSLDILTSDWGMAMSPKRITVSSIGVKPAMIKFLELSQCHLAISLHNPFDEERKALMPIENVYPIHDVVDEIRKYDFSGQRRVSFEYIMFEGLNDTQMHVREMVKLLSKLYCRVNLIRFHPIPNSPLKGSSDEQILKFRDALTARGVFTTIRASRGLDNQAACGLLSTKEQMQKE
ncbi:MAG: 23S rRNA (adenine(2503)-C(2))-methyltransferase RlmN [Bacteroidales bacterium]|nr:23S rRNA (adenine(2503)-C(2))-methyltransferase RlmN [Bacteroidales bacterium]